MSKFANDNQGMQNRQRRKNWPELESGLPAGSRLAWRFTSIFRRKPNYWLSFSPILKKIGQNWNPGYPPVRALHGASLRFSDESQTIGFLSAQF